MRSEPTGTRIDISTNHTPLERRAGPGRLLSSVVLTAASSFRWTILAAVAVISIGGCAFPRQAAGTSQNPSELSTLACPGDPEDLGPAVGLGIGHVGLAFLDSQGPDAEGWVRYQLTDVCDRPVLFSIRPAPAGGGSGFEMSCHWGVFGDGPRQRWLLRCVAQRFAELRGVELAPVGDLPDYDPAG